MYAALWRVIPGPIVVKILVLCVLVAAALFVLIEWVFPWMDTLLGNQEGTVGTGA